jgi:hypothetical protein
MATVMKLSPLNDRDANDWNDVKMQNWRSNLLNAIKRRTVGDVEVLLDSPPGELCDILNTPLIKNDSKPTRRYNGSAESFGSNCTRFSLPIFLAAVHGDAEIVDLLCDNGASIYSKDIEGDNVIHALIWIAAFKSEKEKDLCVMFEKLMTLAGTEEKKKSLLIVEDIDGLRPIELASKLGMFLFILHIMETEGVYKSVSTVSPIARKVTYDVSEYEYLGPKSRALLSPLFFLRQMTDEEMGKEGAVEIFKHPAMTKWIDWKLSRSYKMVVIAFLMLFANALAIFLLDEFGQSDTCPVNSNITVFSIPSALKFTFFYIDVGLELLHVCAIMCFLARRYWIVQRDHPSGVCRLKRPRVLNNGHARLSGGTFFLIHGMKTLSLLTYALVTLSVSNWSEGILGEAMLINRVIIQIMIMLSLLYYVQLFPGIGYTVTGIARCINISSCFLVVFLMFYVAAAAGVWSVARYFCLPVLGYSADSLYSTLLITLNMMDLRDLVGGYAQLPFSLIVIHLFIVCIIATLLLNYLIALLSDVVVKVEDYKTIIYNMSRLNVAIDFMFFPNEFYGLLPESLQWKQASLLIDAEEYTV